MSTIALNKPSVSGVSRLEFQVPLMVLGYAAVVYSTQYGKAVPRHWGSGLAGRALDLGNDRYRFARLRHEGVDGLAITKDTNHWGGGEKSTRILWIPFTECGELTVSCLGKVIG